MFDFILKDHPHKIVVHGLKVQAITDVKMIAVKEEGKDRYVQCGYCGSSSGMPITLIRHYPQAFVDAVKEFVENEVGEVTTVARPPKGR